jgi:ubiquinone/menaquinone biosynthesis C-methylase UbiE
MIMNRTEFKELIKSTFNTVSDGYGHSAMQLFSESAQQIPRYLNLRGDEHVLDVATGTGYVALSVARELPDGKVTGIDFSSGMLAQATKNRDEQGVGNVTFREMDMEAIDFQDEYFDVAVSAFSIFFVEDMKKLLLHIAEKVKVGGVVLTTTFSENAFSPLINLFLDRLNKYGIEVPSLAWKRVATEEQCISLFQDSEFHKIQIEQKECGYYLKDGADWWYIIWNGGFRGLVSKLSEDDLRRFKEEHLAEVEELKTDKGIWLEMSIIYTIGEKYL